MKKFIVRAYGKREPVTVTVDDGDAYLLRGMVWHRDGNSKRVVRYTGMGSTLALSNQLLDLPAGIKVIHLNGDATDYSRKNLAAPVAIPA